MYQYNPLLILEGWKEQLLKDPSVITRETDPIKKTALKHLRRRLVNGRKVMPDKIKRDVVGYIPQGKLTKGWKKRAIRIEKPDSIVHKLQWKGRGDKLTADEFVNRNLGKSINLDKKISKRKPGNLKDAFDDAKYWGTW